MNSLPRICLISSGLDRFYESNTLLLKKQLGLDLIPIDFYGLFWEPVNSLKINAFSNGFHTSTVWTKPQRSFEDFNGINKAPETNTKNFLSMAWGRWLLAQQMKQYEIWDQYDIFIYCRPDVCLNSPINFDELLPILEKFDILVPSNGHHRGGVNDQLAIGGQKMFTYLNLFSEIANYIGEKILFHPETMLLHHLKVHDVQLAAYPFVNFIFRSDTKFDIG
jgi:hypothetical protein